MAKKSITSQFHFCAGHRLLDYEGKCNNIHGHNFMVEATVTGVNLNHCGLLIDFSEVKGFLKDWVDKWWDHGFIANYNDPIIDALNKDGSKIYFITDGTMDEIYNSGKVITSDIGAAKATAGYCNPTVENLSAILAHVLQNHLDTLPGQLQVDKMVLRESYSGCATWEKD